jgi:DnaJ-class molecular chaperone
MCGAQVDDEHQMHRIIKCWAMAEKRAKHLCAFETLGLNSRCRKPSQQEVKKAWHQLCLRLHPDKNASADLATEATRCINLAKQHLFEDFYGDAEARVAYKHRERQADGVVIVVDVPAPESSSSASPGKRPAPEDAISEPSADSEASTKRQRSDRDEMTSLNQTQARDLDGRSSQQEGLGEVRIDADGIRLQG